MSVYLQSLGCGVWNAVISDYILQKRVRTTSQKESKKNNSRAMEAILDGLPQPVKEKIGECISAKELWVKLEKLCSVEQRAKERLAIIEDDIKDEENPFMGTVASKDDSDMEEEVDIKPKLIRSLEELRKSGMKNNSLKEKWSKYQEEHKFREKKNNFYSKEDNDGQSNDAEILFIGTTNLDEESEVDIEAQYMVDVDEI